MDIINPNEEKKPAAETLELEVVALRRALEAEQAGRQKDQAEIKELRWLMDERIAQESDKKAAERVAKLESEAEAKELARQSDSRPYTPPRPSTYAEYIQHPTKIRSEIIRLYTQEYVEQLQAKHYAEKARRRDLGLDKLGGGDDKK